MASIPRDTHEMMMMMMMMMIMRTSRWSGRSCRRRLPGPLALCELEGHWMGVSPHPSFTTPPTRASLLTEVVLCCILAQGLRCVELPQWRTSVQPYWSPRLKKVVAEKGPHLVGWLVCRREWGVPSGE